MRGHSLIVSTLLVLCAAGTACARDAQRTPDVIYVPTPRKAR